MLSARLTVEELTLYGGGLHKPPFATAVPNKFLHSYVHSFIREAIIKTPCTPTAASSPYSDTQVVRGLGIDLTPSSRERDLLLWFSIREIFIRDQLLRTLPLFFKDTLPTTPKFNVRGPRRQREVRKHSSNGKKETQLITSLAIPC